jgi:type II secretory pathway pseudopilin PulG
MQLSTNYRPARSQRGYVLLTLLLFVTLLVISAAVVTTDMAMQIRRDREEELIHRGTEYRRAISRFAHSTGHFPTKLEDLESTNGARYIRKRYKDPMTGRDFRLLHMNEVPAAMGTSANAWSLQAAPTDNNGSDPAQPSDDSSSNAAQGSAVAELPTQTNIGFASPNSNGQSGFSGNSTGDNTTFGGIGIIGVVSTSPKKTIREFNSKNRYNQWFFFYDPTFDRGFDMPGPTPLVRPPAGLQGPPNSTNQPSPFTPAPQPSPQGATAPPQQQ